ncbi:Protein of uncharacterised function (DUF2637) [Mycobacteroides abscessus subsp. bolletii]|uniref:Protein of uncharacterized function (DUF2637) n=1 Tax=Mycobacteroides abscessus subsp. bolletii TaxID=319705 RepID=A0A9Q7SAI3_9MYCO|nr:DUF2637 domain-containing protein [Mycobacteroides abscessus]SHT85344.1 Protein of uncharacterised function (DUF2637) [Mycobacteroides abscessus subsp. bolletii]SHU09317.1 Protein of uncharacterised function (DUF2637) [Mycobacteroides abscessus subsp. bolletii]SHW85938.1 Protein of uncharacterised function (DUF2637) [Mycobacteroides abscessus subsp. bolletii]SKL90821.1 Protein of uncharacterised function (DUF2637) [Mycobacteroides abscessus subsp. bolletii]SKM63363.1 Protein of uncharacteri
MGLNLDVHLAVKHHRSTRRLMWAMLVCATAMSMAGNIAHATAHDSTADARGSVLAAAIPPLALLSLTHLTGMWSRITARGFVYWCFLAAVTCITAAAFRLSFDALRTLAMQYGYGRTDAALFPLILDGLVAVCTLGLVMLSRIESVEGRDIGDAQKEPAGAPQNPRDAAELIRVRIATSDDAADDADSDAASAALIRPVRRGSETQTSASEHHNGAAACDANRFSAPRQDAPVKHAGASLRHDDSEQDAHLLLAHQLVHEKRTTAEVSVVHRVLARTADKVPSRAVAAEVGFSASKVQRIVKAAKECAASL